MEEYGGDKELNMFEIAVCDNQGLLFAECQSDFESDAKDFIVKFMHSDIARSMDNNISPYHNTGTKQIGEALLESDNVKIFEGAIKNKDMLYWMGYIYRYWNKWLGESSECIYSQADYDYMVIVYNYFHTLSPEQAILRIKSKNK
ncbi:MAG: hypothetical protein A2Y24_08225 [Clostridiales bacterium GWE2_32_10]|nr:MAG: hypothetical protein A2Y24_08225 [Clostridiales bacterium GWE2_32_10]